MNILCRLGFHKIGKKPDLTLYYGKGAGRWSQRVFYCRRCGKNFLFSSTHKPKGRRIR